MGSQPGGWEPVRAKLIAFLSAIQTDADVLIVCSLYKFCLKKNSGVRKSVGDTLWDLTTDPPLIENH